MGQFIPNQSFIRFSSLGLATEENNNLISSPLRGEQDGNETFIPWNEERK